jgi:hypothetical protein
MQVGIEVVSRWPRNRVTTVLAEVLTSGGQSQALTTTVVAGVLSSIAEAAPPLSGGTRPVVIAIGI